MLESILCSAVLSLSAVVTVPARPGTLPAAATANDPKHPVIVHMVSRDQTVTVKAGEKGLLYSLTATSGKVLIANATPDQFSQLQPELYRSIRTSLAAKNDDAIIAIGTIADDR